MFVMCITNNFEPLLCAWEEAIDIVQNSETKAQIRGVPAVMQSDIIIWQHEMILRHSDNLIRTLQMNPFQQRWVKQ